MWSYFFIFLHQVIYNNADEEYSGKLADDTEVKIPVVSVSGNIGKKIANNYLIETATMGFINGYRWVINNMGWLEWMGAILGRISNK